MNTIDVFRGHRVLLEDSHVLENLPSEILEIIRLGNSPRFLDALAEGSLIPTLTLRFFTRFENIYADSCARWITSKPGETTQDPRIIEAFARILPFAPHLLVFLSRYLSLPRHSTQTTTLQCLSELATRNISEIPDINLQRLLLATLRLLNFDKSTFLQTVSASKIQALLQHGDRAVRYLAVRILCQILSASDVKLEEMIEEHVGKEEPVMGDFDGVLVDYGFLSLFEAKRGKDVHEIQEELRISPFEPKFLRPNNFFPLVTSYGSVLLPRPDGIPSLRTSLIPTTTTSENMESFAEALVSSCPILIHGLSGSGKTSLVNDFARELGKDSRMVTLHLNEQTDAKMLIGMYATDSTPGSFTWRAGVLTTAIREGRWVFIEDLDRAPNEVISVILPLIERGELLIPSRGETIRAAPGFKLIASIRTSRNMSGQEQTPAMNMLGARLWTRVPVKMPSLDEFQQIMDGMYPILHKFLPGIISVYESLYTLSQNPSFASRSRTSLGRPISPRDLLKWCRRLEAILIAAGSKSGEEPITEATQDEMFMEAVDCFAGSLQTEDARKTVISCIAENMHISSQRVEHFHTSHVPRYDDNEKYLQIGRVRISKHASSNRIKKPSKKSRPFANTTHAKRLLEQVGVALKMAEPVLLVGETGIGKTTVIQQLADSLGFKLTAVNLSQQSEVGDLLGGFKPVNVRSLAIPLKDEFDDLFFATGISASRNQKYIEQLGKCVAKGQWSKASKLWHEAPRMFERILADVSKLEATKSRNGTEQPLKRRKTESKLQSLVDLKPRWDRFAQNLDQFDVQLSGGSKGFAFTFVEGNIVKAARNGEWVLLDEINLASPDTLESIADLLHSGPGSLPSILLSEKGEIERVRAHPDFRIFGAMNPATDVGKRDLPMGLRSRFTEIYVESPDRNLDDLLSVIKAYLKTSSTNDERAAHDVARLYMNTKRLADEKRLVDGANQIPHFSLRTLTRVLSYVMEIAPSYGLRRALYEGFAMGFLTLLDRESERMLMPLINHHLLDSHGNPQALLAQTPRHPEDGRQYVRFMNKKRDRQYWMMQGRETPQEQPHYIITPFVERNMLNLVRATSTRRFPVLVQGPTSSGKTSMIEYLAKFSGNKFVRINNHEHTDLQEYLGTYVSGLDGQLRFQEGLLVQALREGHWIVLDELNLAPTDVLEALNRLLDDNRELLIPETQEIVRPHENFMLFATQNPPGLYGGRKTLSRAFRNRFLELHFDDIPEDELEFILEHRSQKTAPSDCRRIVSVYKELSRLRQSNRLFEQKDSFATLRDLFRWALRDADNREQLAANGYMLLGERVRKPEERTAVKEIIEKVMKVKIDPAVLYDAASSPEAQLHNETANQQGVVWTGAMRRLYILVSHALRNNEPVLLVGETGCGKTTVCQMLAEAFGKELHIVNAHQNTETGDLIGAQRPVRNRAVIMKQLEDDLTAAISLQKEDTTSATLESLLASYEALSESGLSMIPAELHERIAAGQAKAKALFEWSDGSLVQAMKDGQFFLLDEISLADDSVLERLNSVLESQRTLLLAEKGVHDSFVSAAEGFQFFATMNPGGDYGKRELSPALRNRFTEIWVPSLSDLEDVMQIVQAKLHTQTRKYAKAMVDFAEWFGQTYRSSSSQSISVRDILAWVTFINGCSTSDPYFAILNGAAMVYIDTLGANPAALLAINPDSILEERSKCLRQLGVLLDHDVMAVYSATVTVMNTDTSLAFGAFSSAKKLTASTDTGFAFDAPTTKLNAMRVVRALQVQKPILIEGSPGVGKTTLIAALAKAVGQPLTRINLSEQTDLMDLFGSDVPVEGAEAGNFAWRDAPFLQAMQNGDWVLLDEMNLASQSVLEGLNACLDHRGEVYISELDQTFKRHPNFSVFAAQNPHHQGGGRKGLPSSFVNRFTVVYADVFRNDDLTMICKHNFPTMDDTIMFNVITFISTLEQEVIYRRRFGSQGGPWEFNLRDTLRWLQLLASRDPLLGASTPADFLNLILRQRFRTPKDRQEVDKIFAQVFGINVPFRHLFHNLALDAYQVGQAYLPRNQLAQTLSFPDMSVISHLAEVESVMMCIQQNLPCILVGPSGSGKSSIIQHVAAATGTELVTFPLNSDIDTMDLVGGFEQVDPQRASGALLNRLSSFLKSRVMSSMPGPVPNEAFILLTLCQNASLGSAKYFSELQQNLISLRDQTSLPEFEEFQAACQTFIDHPNKIESARFEWVDGILVKALEEGKWLVLDNANLCSSSVLDRLNSLLEPNGFLSINEHCGPDGEPKIVKPHPNFRLFLTMDARFGELSRAMRNRSIEIFLETSVVPRTTSEQKLSVQLQIVEASQQRYGKILEVVHTIAQPLSSDHMNLLMSIAIDHLSGADLPLLPRFAQAFAQGLATEGWEISATQMFSRYMETLRTGRKDGQSLGQLIGEMYNMLAVSMQLPQSFIRAQTIHPLSNSPMVPLLQLSSGNEQSFWLGTLFEFGLEILKGRDTLQSQNSTLATLKPSQMTRLQRSMVRNRVSAVTKDSTVRVAEFLASSLSSLDTKLQDSVLDAHNWKIHKLILRTIMQFWFDTFNLTNNSNSFEEATFQAHLAIGRDALASLKADLQVCQESTSMTDLAGTDIINDFEARVVDHFDQNFKLSTGLSMETLWLKFRPLPVAKLETLQTTAELETLADRFDGLRWKVSISVAELAGVMSSLVKAYQLLLSSDVDAHSLVQTLSSELTSLETGISAEVTAVTPFLVAQFESLRQYTLLEAMRVGVSDNDNSVLAAMDTAVLASQPTSSLMRLACATPTSQTLFNIDNLWGQGTGLDPINDSFAASLLHQLYSTSNVNLNSLRLLEAELPMLANKITQASSFLSRDHINDMNLILNDLMMSVFSAHGEEVAKPFKEWAHQIFSTNDTHILPPNFSKSTKFYHLDSVLEAHFVPAMVAISASKTDTANRINSSAIAWVHFAVGCLVLYVPDRSFDPDQRKRLERDRHVQMRKTLQENLTSLREFELMFTGQNSTLRCQLLEEELEDLGEPSLILEDIFRPEVSELDQLQGEFNNLLNTVLQAKPQELVSQMLTSQSDDAEQALKLLQLNMVQIIRRFSERFRAYSDMTVPLVSMLRCLQIGLFMAGLVSKDESSTTAITALSQMTPYLGGLPTSSSTSNLEHPLEVMSKTATIAAIEGVESFDSDRRKSLFELFHSCFEQWNKRLEADRDEAEAKTGLYRFRGSAEDEEEDDQDQFNELFPSYDDENTHQVGSVIHHSSRDTAIAIAKVHAEIFLENTAPALSITSLLRQMANRIGALYKDNGTFAGSMTHALLPGAMLLLDDQLESLSASVTASETHNFYLDANLPEARKLVELIHLIQIRFKELQNVDEIGHMQPLEDVLVSCRELLEFSHTEPIAKIIMKVEKVHTVMHEWQFGGWASRANSVLALYDRLTATIVDWRRLELSTWAKLFEMENKSCHDDAKSWWFIAYQVVIAAPLAISESEGELKIYAEKLLKDLETYFTTAIQGQFSQRLKMLRQLQKHLQLLALDFPLMIVINDAVMSFVEIYARYEPSVIENMRKGRQVLEKNMKEVLLLASWKDTNIVALRDSAKRSHHKLFKLVRKYRSLLGQPMELVLKQGLPEDSDSADRGLIYNPPKQLPMVDQAALAFCQAQVPEWSKKSKRFVNVSKTVSMMEDASQHPEDIIDGAEYLDSFLANIITSTAELQKATPSVLTDDNKVTVKHLKSRKRKLFADTLKELRQMGIKHNLGTSALSKQESLSVILADISHLPASQAMDSKDLQYYYHKTLDMVPRARASTRNHSEDLSLAEVARSTGLLEGLLQIVLKQRSFLSAAVVDFDKLSHAIEKSQSLWAPDTYDIKLMTTTSPYETTLKWLPNIIQVGNDLVQIHGKLGKMNIQPVQDLLSSWKEKFDDLARRAKDLPRIPGNMTSTSHETTGLNAYEAFQAFLAELVELHEKRPDLGYIIQQIVPWTATSPQPLPVVDVSADVRELDQTLSKVCDSVLVAIENLSKSIKTLPTSAEEPAWLVADDACLVDNIACLHSGEIGAQITDALSMAMSLDLTDETVSRSAGAVFAVALPIFQQYRNILQQSIARYAQLHRATCKTTYILAKTFSQIASEGFCTPSEKSDAQDGKTDKLEGGTGLGDGEGADDISKDIQEDEDLSELAQEPNTGEKDEIEDEQDAVDMADGDMEGEMGDAEEKGDDEEGSGDEEDGDEMDEETGDVDDLDPNAVDEKMWDGDGEKADKEQEGDESKGTASKDEQVAAQENDKTAESGDEGDDEEEEEAAGAEQSEEVQQEEIEKHDPHAQEGEALELPDEMDLDGKDEEGSVAGSEDGMDDLSDADDMDKEGKEEIDESNEKPADGEDAEGQEDQEMGSDLDVIDLDEEDDPENENGGEDTQDAGEKAEDEKEEEPAEEQEGLLRDNTDDATADADNAVPSDVHGTGEDQDENQKNDNTESTSKAQHDDGGQGGDSSEQREDAAEDGDKARQANGEAPQSQSDDTQNVAEAQPFKKLGDALEKWHRQQTKIREAPEPQEKSQDQPMDFSGENTEFQHLQDDEAEADAQALGTASEEQAHALDESMAVDTETQDLPETFQPNEIEQDDVDHDGMDIEEPSDAKDPESADAYEGRAGAMIKQANADQDFEPEEPRAQELSELEEDVEEVDNQLLATHLDDPDQLALSRSAADSRQLWTKYESLTRDLSLSLTEQLRLILAPTLATKMRGDFRTGKRLNIKRIIPYIASQYKRDKIWMRRSVPSKRSYQIMLAVDDSKSMGESGSGSLAFETLVMVSKSLSMLEVGEICVVGFGEKVRVAHDFDAPFSSDAGPKVFQNFGFDQPRTDVTRLVRESIELFRAARAKASSSPTDLWQLELIISDGVCDSSEHEPIRRLLREAIEERIMMVFVIVDDVKNKKKGESVMDLKEAKFVKNEMTGASNVKIERYLDTFPFQYYLVVSDVKELPGVLATLLRQWFSEVADSSG